MSQECVSVNDSMLAWYDAKPNSAALNAVLPVPSASIATEETSDDAGAVNAPAPVDTVSTLTAAARAIDVYATAHSIYIGTMVVALTPARAELVTPLAAQNAEVANLYAFDSKTVAMELRARLGRRPRTPANLEMGGRVAREILKDAGVARADLHYMSVLAVNMWFQATQLDCVLEVTKTSDF